MILRIGSLGMLTIASLFLINSASAQIVPSRLNSLDSSDKIQIRVRPIPSRNIGHFRLISFAQFSGGGLVDANAYVVNGAYCRLYFTPIGSSPSDFSLSDGGTTSVRTRRNFGVRVQEIGSSIFGRHSRFYLPLNIEHGDSYLICLKAPGDTSPFTDQDLVDIMGTDTLQFVGNTIPYRDHGIASPEQNSFVIRPLYTPEDSHVLRPSTTAVPEPFYTGPDAAAAE